MTYKQILEIEDFNIDSIYLFHEGIFYRAYEHSAFFFQKLCHNYKLKRKIIQNVNREVIYLGFPETSLEKWAHKFIREQVNEKLIRLHHRETFDEIEYDRWKDLCEVNVDKRYTPNTVFMEGKPIYRKVQILQHKIIALAKNFSKNFQTPYGTEIKKEAYELAYKIRRYYDHADIEELTEAICEHCDRMAFITQIAAEEKEMSHDNEGFCMELIESVRDQAILLKEKARKV